ncbi:MAG: hypothetical protein L3J39_16965 [Verrucomicrobiales bacterium]|nr:hypothetical protein [Verrucomicrobiales bacterium]
MIKAKPIHFIRLSLFCLLVTSACQRREDGTTSDPPLSPIEKEYTQLQQRYQRLQAEIVKLQQQNETFQASETSILKQDQAVADRLVQTQKKLNAQNREYQALQQDYADLKKSISPLDSSLKTLTAAFRENLIGTQLGTVVLNNGRQLPQCTVIQISDDTLRVKYTAGWVNIPYAQLSPELQKRFFPAPVLVSSQTLLAEEKPTQSAKSASPTKTQESPTSLLEKAFIQRQRRELEQYQLSIPPKIKLLETKISRAQQKIASLRKDRIKTSQYYRKRSGSIKRSPVDLDRSLKKIDGDIRKLELAIEVAQTQIKSWKKELK